MEAEERFTALLEQFVGLPDVALPSQDGRRRFGSQALKVDGSIFAMVTGGSLVVKLPRDRVQALIGDGTGTSFESGRGRPMKEWLRVAVDEDDDMWLTLAREALDFVRSSSR